MERERERMMKAKEELIEVLKDMVKLSYRQQRCPDPGCHVCLENKIILKTALELVKKYS